MINADKFLANLNKAGVNFISGVPDSLLKDLSFSLSKKKIVKNHIIAANEGGAIGLAIGNYIGTGNVPLVYLQNSGLGNTINPLLSLASPKVYGVPILIIMGWRGAPKIKDEPQHIHQGQVTESLIRSMKFPHQILSKNETIAFSQTKEAIKIAKKKNSPFFLLVKKNTFEKFHSKETSNISELNREETISECLNFLPKKSVIVCTTGMSSRELFEIRTKNKSGHFQDFLTVGGMGHASQIALGISESKPKRYVYCFDGDGAALMHMGALAIIGQSNSKKFIHILFNNGVHDSVGGQPTVGLKIDFCDIALACGYESSSKVRTLKQLKSAIGMSKKNNGPHFIEVLVNSGSRKDLGRPTSSPKDNKISIMNYLKKL